MPARAFSVQGWGESGLTRGSPVFGWALRMRPSDRFGLTTTQFSACPGRSDAVLRRNRRLPLR